MGIKIGQELNIVEGQTAPIQQELRPVIVYAKKEVEKPVFVNTTTTEDTVTESVVIETKVSDDSFEFFDKNSRYMNDLLTTKE